MNKKLFYIINNVNDCNNKSFLYYSSSNLNGQRVLEILINPQFNLKKSDILSSFIVFYSSNSPRKHDDDILKALLISIMKELYNYDIECDHLIYPPKLLPSGDSFLISIHLVTKMKSTSYLKMEPI